MEVKSYISDVLKKYPPTLIVKNAFISILSGITDMKNEKEMWIQDINNRYLTIEFYNKKASDFIMRRYWSNGNKITEIKYKNDKLIYVKLFNKKGKEVENFSCRQLSEYTTLGGWNKTPT